MTHTNPNGEQGALGGPLSMRMRIAANTLEEFNHRLEKENWGAPGAAGIGAFYSTDTGWRPSELRREARHVEDEEQEEAERDLMVEELAEALCEAHNEINTDDPFGPLARILIAIWRKDI